MRRPSYFAVFETALGPCAVTWGARGIQRVLLPEASRTHLVGRVRQDYDAITEREPPPAVRRAMDAIARHLAGKPTRFDDVAVDMEGLPPFRLKVYAALREVPAGATISYAELAARAGSPAGARAVGQAMAQNPFPVVVPCHRVLAAGHEPGGFSAYGGVVTKARLLALEGVQIREARAKGGSLPFDWSAAVRVLKRRDRGIGRVIDGASRRRLELKNARTSFESLAEAIVYQQLSGKAAAAIFSRVRGLFPGRRGLGPRDVASSNDARLRGAGLSRAKAASLRDLAERTVAGEIPSLERLRQMDDEAIVAALTRVRGVGRWTVEMLLIFQLGRPDVLPLGDLGIKKGFARAFDLAEPATAEQLAERGERWRPYRTVASWYLWRALDR